MNGQYFQQLNIIHAEYDKVWTYCPYHKDTIRPNLSISLLDKYYGRYKCWACGKRGHLDKWQMDKLNLSSFTVHKNNEDNLLTRWKQFTESCYDNLQRLPLLKLGLAKQLNIGTKSLDDWLVGYDGISFTIPMLREDLSEYFREKGLCGVQRRYPDGSKRCIRGSHLGLMYSYEYLDSDDYIFICEGFSDGISVYDLGLNSVARPHCRHTEGIEELFDDFLSGVESIIIIPDNDTVGHKGAYELYKKLKWDYDCDVFQFDGAKDIRDYIAIKGKEAVKKELRRMI